jgi:hypothetical protein
VLLFPPSGEYHGPNCIDERRPRHIYALSRRLFDDVVVLHVYRDMEAMVPSPSSKVIGRVQSSRHSGQLAQSMEEAVERGVPPGICQKALPRRNQGSLSTRRMGSTEGQCCCIGQRRSVLSVSGRISSAKPRLDSHT